MVYVTSENSYLKTRVELVPKDEFESSISALWVLRFRPLSYFGISPVGFKPTTTFIDQIRILGRSFSYALWGQNAHSIRFELIYHAFGERCFPIRPPVHYSSWNNFHVELPCYAQGPLDFQSSASTKLAWTPICVDVSRPSTYPSL